MKKVSLLFLLLNLHVYGQNGFHNAYIIKTDGDTINAFVQKFATNSEVVKITYKSKNENDLQSIDADLVSQIVMTKRMKRYLVHDVEIDNSSNKLDKLAGQDRTKNFNFEKRKLYLQLLVDGEVPLYMSKLSGTEKFFIRDRNGEIKQLLYKKYFWKRGPFYAGNDHADENNFYYRQLYSEARCLNNKNEFEPPEFKKVSLVAYFERFNSGKCSNKSG